MNYRMLHRELDLPAAYTAEVIGGPNARAVTFRTDQHFIEVTRYKLIRDVNRPVV